MCFFQNLESLGLLEGFTKGLLSYRNYSTYTILNGYIPPITTIGNLYIAEESRSPAIISLDPYLPGNFIKPTLFGNGLYSLRPRMRVPGDNFHP